MELPLDDPLRAEEPRGTQAPHDVTALIVLGVAMMSGAYVLTDTIEKAFDSILTDSYAGTDAVVTGKDPGFSFEGESASRRRFPRGRWNRCAPSTASRLPRARCRTSGRSS